MSNHTQSKLFRCEPQILGEASSRRVQLLQGGLIEGKPSIEFQLEWEGGTMSFLLWVHEIRTSLDILEPVKPKRVRTRTKTNSPAAQEVLNRVVTGKGEHHG